LICQDGRTINAARGAAVNINYPSTETRTSSDDAFDERVYQLVQERLAERAHNGIDTTTADRLRIEEWAYDCAYVESMFWGA
jgi:hypothetical protein